MRSGCGQSLAHTHRPGAASIRRRASGVTSAKPGVCVERRYGPEKLEPDAIERREIEQPPEARARHTVACLDMTEMIDHTTHRQAAQPVDQLRHLIDLREELQMPAQCRDTRGEPRCVIESQARGLGRYIDPDASDAHRIEFEQLSVADGRVD